MLLTSTSDLIQVITGQAVSTINVHASWVDLSGTTVTPGRTNTNITGASTTTIVASPGSSTQRNVKGLYVYNSHATSSDAITVQHTDGTIIAIIVKYTLLAGETLFITETNQIIVMDAAGGLKSSPATGRLLAITLLTSASGTFTTGVATNNIKVRVQAGGGQGGGAHGGSSTASVGGGGSPGGYAEKTFAVSPNTGYSYTCGAGGSSQTTNVTGSVGANSTIVVGSTTVTANGGSGGIGAQVAGTSVAAILGGASAVGSTNGDINIGSTPGGYAWRLSGTVAISGVGGSSYLGAGAQAVTTDVAGNASTVGYGGGGGGACSLTAADRAGGAGGNGCVIVEEYS